MLASSWIAVTVDVDRSTEFTVDDINQYSELCDLGGDYEFLNVLVPALDASGSVVVYIQKDNSVATVPTILTTFKSNGIGHFVLQTGTGAGGLAAIFRVGSCQYLRMRVNADQADDVVFYVRGFNRN